MDNNTKVIKANTAFSEGIPSSVSVIGRTLKELKSGFQDEFFSKTVWNAVEKNGHWCGEIRSLVESGEEEAEWLTLSVVKDEQGETSRHLS
jgi:hypothetical protein